MIMKNVDERSVFCLIGRNLLASRLGNTNGFLGNSLRIKQCWYSQV